jgi:hypothetical protein
VRGNQVLFDQTLSFPITIIYEFKRSNIELRIVERCFTTPPQSPKVNSVTLSYLECA